MKDRKKWLSGKIAELEDKAMFGELSVVDEIFIDGYRSELKIIELKEQGVWREDKTG